jgi:pimeloyl-ACP methyl ester carboxylesterase
LLGAPNPKVPPEWRELDRGLRLQTPQVITTCDEFVAFPRSEHQVRGIRLRPDLPLVVLSAFDPQELPPETPPEDVAAMRRTWHELQMELAGRSSNSVHLPVAHSGHLIPLEQPQAVVAGIRRVVRAVRDGTRVAATGD